MQVQRKDAIRIYKKIIEKVQKEPSVSEYVATILQLFEETANSSFTQVVSEVKITSWVIGYTGKEVSSCEVILYDTKKKNHTGRMRKEQLPENLKKTKLYNLMEQLESLTAKEITAVARDIKKNKKVQKYFEYNQNHRIHPNYFTLGTNLSFSK